MLSPFILLASIHATHLYYYTTYLLLTSNPSLLFLYAESKNVSVTLNLYELTFPTLFSFSVSNFFPLRTRSVRDGGVEQGKTKMSNCLAGLSILPVHSILVQCLFRLHTSISGLTLSANLSRLAQVAWLPHDPVANKIKYIK